MVVYFTLQSNILWSNFKHFLYLLSRPYIKIFGNYKQVKSQSVSNQCLLLLCLWVKMNGIYSWFGSHDQLSKCSPCSSRMYDVCLSVHWLHYLWPKWFLHFSQFWTQTLYHDQDHLYLYLESLKWQVSHHYTK